MALPWTSDVVAQACQIGGTYGPNVELMWPMLHGTMVRYGLADEARIMAGMCGVIAHETAGRWYPIHEFGNAADFARYGYAPSGQDYGGRGLIQTTWQGNYQSVASYMARHWNMDVDCVNNPDIILQPAIACHAACIYWVSHAGGILIDMCLSQRWDEVIHYVWGANLPGNPHFDQYLTRLRYATNYLLARV